MELEKLGEKIKVFAGVAVDKVTDVVEIAKHNITISGLEKNADDLYKKLGEHIYATSVGGTEYDDAITEICKSINGILFKIESLSMDIETIKATTGTTQAASTPVDVKEEKGAPVEKENPVIILQATYTEVDTAEPEEPVEEVVETIEAEEVKMPQ